MTINLSLLFILQNFYLHRNKFDNVNPNKFSQKDLLLHLLQVSQHSATREDVKTDIGQLDKKFDKEFSKLDAKISKLDTKIDSVE